jgi:uncharacterized protein YciI
MRVLARITPGPSWLPGHTVWEQGPVVQDHLAHMRDGYDAGTLLVGGPVRSGMAGMALLEVENLDDALAFAAADPAVAAKVLAYELAEVLPYFDALSGVRSGGNTRETPTEVSL